MVSFPNGKVNLGLHVTGKREDGFHHIETVFHPIAIHEVVEIILARETSFGSAGLTVDGPPEKNLCLKAFHLLKQDFPNLDEVAIFLYKNIPVGAGLGGGSADAVACLQLLNSIGGLDLSPEQISIYALQLGSDCPFFLLNKTCFAKGRGESLEAINIDLSNYSLLIVNPGIHINTGWAFSNIKVYSPGGELREQIRQPIANWKSTIRNDFEKLVNEKYPETREIKDQMYAKGAIYASLSGTGSTVYGFFEKTNRPQLDLPGTYFIKWL